MYQSYKDTILSDNTVTKETNLNSSTLDTTEEQGKICIQNVIHLYTIPFS